MADAARDDRQPSLLPTSDAHVQFLLSRETRERGLRHVAEIRRQLAEQRAAHDDDDDDDESRFPPSHHEAA